MTIIMTTLHIIAALVVLAEALDKLERISLFVTGLSKSERVQLCLKSIGWLMLALGAAGSFVDGVVSAERLSLWESSVLFGVCALVIKHRLEVMMP